MKKVIVTFCAAIAILCLISSVTTKEVNSEGFFNLINWRQDGQFVRRWTSGSGPNEGAIVQVPDVYFERPLETRAVWVTTVFNIDFPQTRTPEQFMAEYERVLDIFEEFNMNTVFFQVRSMLCAFYPSVHNPVSQFLGMTDSDLANFDPLEFAVQATRARGMEFHAWLNPYRITNSAPASTQDFINSLPARHFTRRVPNDPETGIPTWLRRNSSMILNPACRAVIDHIVDTVMEIVENYDVDGINFDDYFYLQSMPMDIDRQSFDLYRANNPLGLPTGLGQADWRRANVDKMIREVAEAIGEFNENSGRRNGVRFGVSPAGVWAARSRHPQGTNVQGGFESYTHLYADIRKWVLEGWLDYVSPQLYWPIRHHANPYADLVDWWVDVVRQARANGHYVQLNISAGLYRFDDTAPWVAPVTEMADQLLYNSQFPEVNGFTIFSLRNFWSNRASTRAAVEHLRNAWQKRPMSSRAMSTNTNLAVLPSASNIEVQSRGDNLRFRINETCDNVFYYVIYKTPKGTPVNFDNPGHFMGAIRGMGAGNLTVRDLSVRNYKNYDFYLRVIDFQNRESATALAITNIAESQPPQVPETLDLEGLIRGYAYGGTQVIVSFAAPYDVLGDPLNFTLELFIDGRSQVIVGSPVYNQQTGRYEFTWNVLPWTRGQIAYFRLTTTNNHQTVESRSRYFRVAEENAARDLASILENMIFRQLR
ncbi:MAG: family 10 glycosylhydrolase [Erysipelotrichales bacterium]|nr:family 10 glycosylhydrolase [Erysipelotrichales bacterium]